MIYSVVLLGRIPVFRGGGMPPFQRTNHTGPIALLHPARCEREGPAPCEVEGGVTRVGLLRWEGRAELGHLPASKCVTEGWDVVPTASHFFINQAYANETWPV